MDEFETDPFHGPLLVAPSARQLRVFGALPLLSALPGSSVNVLCNLLQTLLVLAVLESLVTRE